MKFFIDAAGTVSNVRRTPQGGMLLEATLAKVGVMDYMDGGKIVRRYNPPEVLIAALDSIATAPVTNRHPARFVDTSSYQKLAAGHVVGTPTFVDGHIRATLAIQDADLIADIENGVARELSLGYQADHDGKPGVTEDGESYHEARTKITVNHNAVVPEGRAGRSVRLQLDSAEIPRGDVQMTLKIGSQVVDGASAQATFDSYDAGLQAQIAELTVARDTLKTQLDALQGQLTVAQSDEAINARIAERDAKVAAEAAVAAKTKRVQDAYPTMDLAGKSEAFIDGLDAAIAARVVTDPENLGAVQSAKTTDSAPVKPVGKVRVSPAEQLRLDVIAAGRAPLVAPKA